MPAEVAGLRSSRVAALVALAVAGACRPSPKACYVTAVSVAGEGAADVRGLERDDLRRAAFAAFAGAPGFSVPPAEPGSGVPRCRATIALLDARLPVEPAGRVEVVLGLRVARGDEGEDYQETVRYGEAVRPGEDLGSALRRAVDGAAGRAVAALGLALGEAAKPTPEVLRDLESSDARTRDLAVRVLAERRNPAAVPGLVRRLSDPDPDVVERAVGALAQIRDPRAVGPLIGLTQRREGDFVTQLVLIIGDIGGPEAEAYLGTLAEGHPDPAVKKAARDSLATLRRRGASPPPAPARP
ncbi:MAG TPA: HEAT repeat domain-containing protein [Anaeromyxobacteraceae bacterium]|nr:HEAT repeat domain-containing protein [Anaeromyxobacteraceae bacterium]